MHESYCLLLCCIFVIQNTTKGMSFVTHSFTPPLGIIIAFYIFKNQTNLLMIYKYKNVRLLEGFLSYCIFNQFLLTTAHILYHREFKVLSILINCTVPEATQLYLPCTSLTTKEKWIIGDIYREIHTHNT